ncbi:phage tail tape measure protein [Proteus mirabilis]|uniref:phage tail tape measure protein n=1 Tax=Proteus mirabilis TaxID=584 RepID=UPI0022B44B68|nr:phage tail tape measure protein [Proteus mirabilis]MCZ4571852.1 phage tail tape measure protein [Proteus mirabilis]MCZ4659196.1 phage tail tape measure protein [Proteus mirabilis]MCZ4666700.1 phage tail tape measure protein [Proteus mirabilis]HCR3212122.1 phage tail tape measure protein [Proteus mirabilis]
MATNLADLRVGLLLNDASFRSNISGALNHAGRETERFSNKAKRETKAVADGFYSISHQVTNVAGRLAMLGGVSLSIGSILNISRKYSQAISDLSAITGASIERMKEYSIASQEMGRTTEFGAIKVADAMKLIASAKPSLLQTAGALEEVTAKSITLAQASGVELADAAKSLTLSLNQFGESAVSSERYINVLAAGAKYGASEINETAQAIVKSGTVASQAGISFEQLNASIQVLAGKGIKAETAGTMLRNVFLALERSADKNLRPSVVGLATALENLDKKNYSTTASTKIFGRANVSAGTILVKNRDQLVDLTKALTDTETAYEQAGKRAQNLNADLEVMERSFEGLAIKVGTSADGPLRTGVQNVTSAVNALNNNFSTLANIATYAVLPVIGARMTRGLQEQTKEWVKNEAAVRSNAKQQAETARRGIASADATINKLAQQGQALTQQSAIMNRHGLQMQGLASERNRLVRQEAEALALRSKYTDQLTAANNRLSYSQRALRASSLGLRSVVSALGGPVGVLALAGSAIYYFATKADEAKLKVDGLRGSVAETIEELQRLSRVKLEIQADEIAENISLLEAERSRIYGELARYSEDRQISMSEIKDSGWFGNAMVSAFGDDPEEVLRNRRSALGKLEDINKDLETQYQRQTRTKEAIEKGIFSQPTKEDKPVGDGGSGGGGNDLTSGSKQKVNQYHQLRMQIEQEHATSLERISLSESETMRKLQENLKAGGMQQAEYERLKTLNAENHMKQRAELAEKYSPMRASIRNEQEMTKELKSLFEQQLLTEKEYQYARRQMAQDTTKYRLSEQAKGISLPNISILGEIDPVIQLRNQLEEQKALYQAYYEDGLVSKERYEQLVIAATNKSKEAQYQSSKELYASQGMWQRMQMNLVDAVEQRTANMMTGMLMGTKSFSEGIKEFSSSLASSIISDLIRIAIQAQITNALTGLMGGFAGGSSGAASGAKAGKVGVKANAKGDVYSSPSLSQYSNQVVSSPTLFAFAKGGTPNLGLMGEAGSEAIMPLKRGPDGSLGVRATGSNSIASGDTIIHQTFHVTGNGDEALYQAMQEAARIGAEQGASKAKSDIMRDFQTNGTLRRNLR